MIKNNAMKKLLSPVNYKYDDHQLETFIAFIDYERAMDERWALD